MKKILFYLIGIVFSAAVFAQGAPEKKIYEDLGIFKLRDGENSVSIGGFITIEEEYGENHVQQQIQEVRKEVYNKKKFDTYNESPELMYHYDIYFVSMSVFEGDTTSTWMYGMKIFADGEQIMKEQFPDGFIVSIKTEPTLIHTYHSKSDEVMFDIEWEKLIYEQRIRK